MPRTASAVIRLVVGAALALGFAGCTYTPAPPAAGSLAVTETAAAAADDSARPRSSPPRDQLAAVILEREFSDDAGVTSLCQLTLQVVKSGTRPSTDEDANRTDAFIRDNDWQEPSVDPDAVPTEVAVLVRDTPAGIARSAQIWENLIINAVRQGGLLPPGISISSSNSCA